jgi:hypothetical protein
MAAVAILLDALPGPFTDGVCEVYRWLECILGAVAEQQEECSLLHWVKASILPPPTPKMRDRGPPKELQMREWLPH